MFSSLVFDGKSIELYFRVVISLVVIASLEVTLRAIKTSLRDVL